MARWLKLGYFKEVRSDPSYWHTVDWVSDSPGRVSPRWKTRSRPRRAERNPVFGPRYQVGDRLVMYLTEIACCPAILEVTDAPRWDPAAVDASHAGEGDRWGVLTPVKFVAATSIDTAPGLEDLGVAAASIARKGHARLLEWQYVEAERLIGAGYSDAPDPAPEHKFVPIEVGRVDGYDVTSAETVKKATRRESRLVRDFAAYLAARSNDVWRSEIRPGPGQGVLYSDVFNKTKHQLIEAKVSADRGSLRMAIGQLADYARFVDPPPARAVLLEAKPPPDLIDLLTSQSIAVIWRVGESFTDNAGGRFI